MQTESNTENIINIFLQGLANGETDAVAGLFAEEIDWYVPGNNALPWTGHRSHRNEVSLYFRTMWSHFEKGKSASTLDKLVISGNDAVVFATFTNTVISTGRTFQTPVAMHVVLSSNKIVSLHLYEDTWLVSNAFFD